jgi:hypothetical protein
VRPRILWIAIVVLAAVAAFIWWPRSPGPILPAAPNPFVKSVTIVPLDIDPDAPLPRITFPNGMTIEDTEHVSLARDPKDTEPFSETIEIAAPGGQYVQSELERHNSPPEAIEERHVATPDRWPITFAVYRRDNSPEQALEFQCFVMEGTVERPPAGETHLHPPLTLVRVGSNELRSERGFAGLPIIGPPRLGSNLYWTFFFPPDKENPTGEYVYEVRLYPTARWVSDIRTETGDPIVLRRGKLIVVQEEEPAANEDAEIPG